MVSDTSGGANSVPVVSADALSNPEKLLAQYFSSATTGLCILDSEFRYLAINNTLAEMHGIPAQIHPGKTVREVRGGFADGVEPELRACSPPGCTPHNH